MAFAVSSLIGRLRQKVDLVEDIKDEIPQDGTSYTVVLTRKPIISGTNEVYIAHSTNTTGYFQFVPENGTQVSPYLDSTNLVYNINLTRGELKFYQGSGYVVGSGLNPFAPWNTSTVTAYYQAAKYSDRVLADYISYAVAPVESALQIGMYVSGVSGVNAPVLRNWNDSVDYFTTKPYQTNEKYIIAEDLEIIQELIAQRAAFDLLMRERRVGAGNAIKIVDGDTQIDTSVNQRYVADLLKDVKQNYIDMLKDVRYNMLEGFSLKQIDDMLGANTFGSSRNAFGTSNSSTVYWE